MPESGGGSGERQFAKIFIDGAESSFRLLTLTASERISECYTIRAHVSTKAESTDVESVIGKKIAIKVGTDGTGRHFSGTIFEAGYLGDEYDGPDSRPRSVFELVIRPKLFLQSQTIRSKIYKEKKISDIVSEMMSEAGLQTNGTPATNVIFPFYVQYSESNLNFLNRTLEYGGIHYYFEHNASEEKLILANSNSTHKASATCSDIEFNDQAARSGGMAVFDTITAVSTRVRTLPAAITLHDASYTNGYRKMIAQKPDNAKKAFETGKITEHPGAFIWEMHKEVKVVDVGSDLANHKLLALRAQREEITLAGPVTGLMPGEKFTLAKHRSSQLNIEYLVVATEYSVTANDSGSSGTSDGFVNCTITAIPASKPYRTPLKTPWPLVQGPQPAVVVSGPETSQGVPTDKLGRVQIKFPWAEESEAAYVRISQMWASNNFGAMAPPRVNDEVIVEFIDGNPNFPLITGRVYNGKNTPPYAGASAGHYFTIKSERGNELRFDDKSGKEEVFLTAKYDMNTKVLNSQTLEVTKDRSLKIMQGNLKTEVQAGNIEEKAAAGSIKVEAAQSIEFKVGGSSIKMDPSTITIKAPFIKIEASATLDAKSTMTTIKGDGMLVLKGGMVMIN